MARCRRRNARAVALAALASTSMACGALADETSDGAEPGRVVAELHPVGEPSRIDRRDTEPSVVASTTTTTTVTAPAQTLSLAFTGDVLVHSPIVEQAFRNGGGAFDFAPMFAVVAPSVRAADLAICHLETPVAPPGEALSTAPRYGVPPELAAGLASAGFDRCSTASNHSLDRGIAGIDATIDALGAAGISHAGTTRTGDDPVADIVDVDVDGVAVAHLAYTFGFNGLRLPAGEEWRANLIDPARIVTDAAEARARGADVVVVSLHAGVEGSATPNSLQRDTVAAITAFGVVDLVVGHHAHVLQPIEQVNGVWVAYGLGNFLSNMPTGRRWPASSQDGALLTVEVEVSPDGAVTVARPVVVPTWVDRETFEIRPVSSDLLDPALPAERRAALEASLARTSSVLGDFLG